MSASDPGFRAAVEEAQAGYDEGGVPIGACLVAKDGTIIGKGHNLRVQKGSATLHVSRVVIGENKTFVGGEEYLKHRGIEVVVLDDETCKELMRKFINEKPDVW
ncbi:cytosine deaminase [Lithohypha guttulata]|uniref:Cytosine deaminase n=1 Tax=Lithohypha guttulata TaxID=1690604 RepID=UPI002DE1AB3C|nr:cytosine deaminase [Lithohypha guttulata]KAK5099857.1 cytosine deaminase [Lithohypha guttulata]